MCGLGHLWVQPPSMHTDHSMVNPSMNSTLVLAWGFAPLDASLALVGE